MRAKATQLWEWQARTSVDCFAPTGHTARSPPFSTTALLTALNTQS